MGVAANIGITVSRLLRRKLHTKIWAVTRIPVGGSNEPRTWPTGSLYLLLLLFTHQGRLGVGSGLRPRTQKLRASLEQFRTPGLLQVGKSIYLNGAGTVARCSERGDRILNLHLGEESLPGGKIRPVDHQQCLEPVRYLDASLEQENPPEARPQIRTPTRRSDRHKSGLGFAEVTPRASIIRMDHSGSAPHRRQRGRHPLGTIGRP